VIVHNVEWVVKISKLCNLRCTYCYEFPFLADRTRMRLEDLRIMFRHIAEFYAARPKRMDLVWHGGEPLLIEPTYYSVRRGDPGQEMATCLVTCKSAGCQVTRPVRSFLPLELAPC